ncbi:MAG: hypothetical protein ACOYXR_01585 [Nitrospirota bacterium]
MREHRWETREPVGFDDLLRLCGRLRNAGVPVRAPDQVGACYFEEFWVDRLEDLRRLDPWPIDEVTLIEIDEAWSGDLFVLAGRHHELYRERASMEAYLSISHPWRIPIVGDLSAHHREAMFWVGFRDTHGFIRIRLVPTEILTPGEGGQDARRERWVTERAEALAAALEALDLPLFVDWSEGAPMVGSAEPGCRISGSWPDAFGPCQFEYVIEDRYALLVPTARLVERLGVQPAVLRTYLSGWPTDALSAFHALQPATKLLHRGFVHASLNDLPAIADAVSPRGRVVATLGEFPTASLLPGGHDAYTVLGAVGAHDGFTLEMRLNRLPLSKGDTEAWLEGLVGLSVIYSPLGGY